MSQLRYILEHYRNPLSGKIASKIPSSFAVVGIIFSLVHLIAKNLHERLRKTI